jgi:biopolymer transport protein TolR
MRLIERQWTPSAKQRRARLRGVIDVSGFAGVMLALLFLMMFGLTYPMHPRIAPVDMSAAQHSTLQPAANREDVMEVTIARDGTIFFRNRRILLADIPSVLHEAVRNGAERTVYVKADARAKYADVKVALDAIRSANVTNIAFLTERARAGSTP